MSLPVKESVPVPITTVKQTLQSLLLTRAAGVTPRGGPTARSGRGPIVDE